jgi:hypothetical protein
MLSPKHLEFESASYFDENHQIYYDVGGHHTRAAQVLLDAATKRGVVHVDPDTQMAYLDAIDRNPDLCLPLAYSLAKKVYLEREKPTQVATGNPSNQLPVPAGKPTRSSTSSITNEQLLNAVIAHGKIRRSDDDAKPPAPSLEFMVGDKCSTLLEETGGNFPGEDVAVTLESLGQLCEEEIKIRKLSVQEMIKSNVPQIAPINRQQNSHANRVGNRSNRGTMKPHETEPFVVIWSPRKREQQQELYDALKRLRGAEELQKVKDIATKYGVPGFEFQLYEIEEANSPMDGKLGIKICFDQNILENSGEKTIWKLLEEMDGIIKLPTALVTDDYHPSGEKRVFHDNIHTNKHQLEKLFDSRPLPKILLGN